MTPRILYEDNHLLVADKPKGMLTQANGSGDTSLHELCKQYLKEKYAKQGNVFLEPIHRLDRPVGGIVVFAKTSKALARLQASIRNREVGKSYLAHVEAAPKEDAGTLEHYLIHEEHHARVAPQGHPEAKRAILHYKVVKREGSGALLHIDLETGRYHQIRAQLSAAGWPIVGDARYGSQTSQGDGIALRHYRMDLPHPITKEKLTIED